MGAIIHFGTDGWRARIDGDFNVENVSRVAGAVAELWQRADAGSIVYVGYDTRPDARRFAVVAAEVLAGYGFDAVLSDKPLPTPALSWTTANDPRACGALMVTGSHHPMDYLGIKLRVSDGGGGTVDFYDDVEELIDPDPAEVRGPIREANLIGAYIEGLERLVDGDAIREAGLTIECDPMYGAARTSLPEVLERVGVTVRVIHADEEPGWREFRPEPIEPWVDDCERAVVESGASAGLITDGDADRIGAVDDRGRYVSPHKIIALIIEHLVRNHGMSGRVVLNLSTSNLPRRVARALGCGVVIKPIGFKYIYEEMLRGDVLIGGEEAGGIGVPVHLRERDAILCCLLLCELMAMSGKSLGQLVDELDERFGTCTYARRDLRLEPEVIESLRMMLPGVNPARVAGMVPSGVSHMDGLRLEFTDGSWLLLRPSGTEALVRVYAEASTVEERDRLIEAGCEIARGNF